MPTTLGFHATILDRAHILCACPELGCNQRTIEYGGKIHQGRIFYRKNYPKHLQNALNHPPSNSPLAIPALASHQSTQLSSATLQREQSEGVSALGHPFRTILSPLMSLLIQPSFNRIKIWPQLLLVPVNPPHNLSCHPLVLLWL